MRDLARIAAGSGSGSSAFSIPDLQARLGPGRQLVEFVESAGSLRAVVVSAGRCRLHDLGPTEEVAGAIDAAVFSLGRLARSGVSAASLEAAAASLDESLSRLDDLLVAPLRLAAERVVIVPTGVLHAMPWGGLRSLRPLEISVATSARRWKPVGGLDVGDPRVGVVVGPGLVDGDGERAAVLAARPNAVALDGDAATVDAVLSLLGRSEIVHLACHGSLRSDSPMFSSLSMADGPLTIYDVEGLSVPPRLVVLAACHAGASAVSVGDEVIGTASALLGAGVEAVIAPIVVVNDAATVAVMAELHRHLTERLAPAAALAAVRRSIATDDIVTDAVVTALLCLE